jgi:hypothetical protein
MIIKKIKGFINKIYLIKRQFVSKGWKPFYRIINGTTVAMIPVVITTRINKLYRTL